MKFTEGVGLETLRLGDAIEKQNRESRIQYSGKSKSETKCWLTPHSPIQVTIDIYGYLVPGGNRAVVDKLDTEFPEEQRQV